MDEPDRSSKPPREARPQSPLPVEVELFDRMSLLDENQLDELRALAARALGQLPNPGQVRVAIVDDRRMSDAHLRFSGDPATTDVLTFDLADDQAPGDDKLLDTDLIVCYDQASRQARDQGHGVVRELLLYIVHGVLHCLGYDDHDPEQYQRMHRREDELLGRIGVGPTFFAQTASNAQENRS